MAKKPRKSTIKFTPLDEAKMYLQAMKDTKAKKQRITPASKLQTQIAYSGLNVRKGKAINPSPTKKQEFDPYKKLPKRRR